MRYAGAPPPVAGNRKKLAKKEDGSGEFRWAMKKGHLSSRHFCSMKIIFEKMMFQTPSLVHLTEFQVSMKKRSEACENFKGCRIWFLLDVQCFPNPGIWMGCFPSSNTELWPLSHHDMGCWHFLAQGDSPVGKRRQIYVKNTHLATGHSNAFQQTHTGWMKQPEIRDI